MKLIRKCALALLTVVLASSLVISCSDGGDEPDIPPPPIDENNRWGEKDWPAKTGGEPEDADLDSLHRMILPSGLNGVDIPKWSEPDADGVKGLPDVVTHFLTADENGKLTVKSASNRTNELLLAMDKANKENFFKDKPVKNVIVVFSDGWGESHVTASRQYYFNHVLALDHMPYRAAINHDSYEKRPNVVTGYPENSKQASIESGTATWCYDVEKNKWYLYGNSKDNTTLICTDSTAGGTAINTGFATYYKACDVDLNSVEVKNILELAREKGMLVANVTNDWLTDATPATVAIHSPKRDDSAIINGRMYLASPDFSMGNGGFKDWISNPSKLWSNNDDGDAVETPRTVVDPVTGEYKWSEDVVLANPKKWYKENSSVVVLESSDTVKGHLTTWFKANEPTLKKWAISMLNEYDQKGLSGEEYNFNNWTADRKLKTYIKLDEMLAEFSGDSTIRPLVSFGKDHDFEYDIPKGKTAPKLGYKLGYNTKNGESQFPNFAEMVASTLYVLDKKAKTQDRGFFAFIENTCPDGWGHASKPHDCMNETQISDEGIAIAAKYVLEHPDTLLVVTADHETGDISFGTDWDKRFDRVTANSSSHSTKPVPIAAFGAGAEANWGDIPAVDTSKWTADDWKNYAMGTVYPKSSQWRTEDFAEAKVKTSAGTDFPKILRNRTTGIRIAKALGFDKFGDLNGNGYLDADTESDSVVSYDKVGTKK